MESWDEKMLELAERMEKIRQEALAQLELEKSREKNIKNLVEQLNNANELAKVDLFACWRCNKISIHEMEYIETHTEPLRPFCDRCVKVCERCGEKYLKGNKIFEHENC